MTRSYGYNDTAQNKFMNTKETTTQDTRDEKKNDGIGMHCTEITSIKEKLPEREGQTLPNIEHLHAYFETFQALWTIFSFVICMHL